MCPSGPLLMDSLQRRSGLLFTTALNTLASLESNWALRLLLAKSNPISVFIISKHTFLHLSDSVSAIQSAFVVWNQIMMKSLNSRSMKIFCLKNTQNLIGMKIPAAGLQFEAMSLRSSWNRGIQRDTSKPAFSYRNVSRLLYFGRQWKGPTWV